MAGEMGGSMQGMLDEFNSGAGGAGGLMGPTAEEEAAVSGFGGLDDMKPQAPMGKLTMQDIAGGMGQGGGKNDGLRMAALAQYKDMSDGSSIGGLMNMMPKPQQQQSRPVMQQQPGGGIPGGQFEKYMQSLMG
ncbi:MAG: hypothetical protein DRI98_06680 [Bacteroidetes bacterium]|nr:MAG: hypothetical protein DRI98_06680 [Bacteroidota bacterium]